MTADHWIYLAVSLLILFVVGRRFFSPNVPTAAATTPRVSARVVPPSPIPTVPTIEQLAMQLHQSVDAQGTALALSRKAAAMIEAKAATTDFPWLATSVAAPPVVPEVPKV